MNPLWLVYLANLVIGAYGLAKEISKWQRQRQGIVCVHGITKDSNTCPHRFPSSPNRWCLACRRSYNLPGDGDNFPERN